MLSRRSLNRIRVLLSIFFEVGQLYLLIVHQSTSVTPASFYSNTWSGRLIVQFPSVQHWSMCVPKLGYPETGKPAGPVPGIPSKHRQLRGPINSIWPDTKELWGSKPRREGTYRHCSVWTISNRPTFKTFRGSTQIQYHLAATPPSLQSCPSSTLYSWGSLLVLTPPNLWKPLMNFMLRSRRSWATNADMLPMVLQRTEASISPWSLSSRMKMWVSISFWWDYIVNPLHKGLAQLHRAMRRAEADGHFVIPGASSTS